SSTNNRPSGGSQGTAFEDCVFIGSEALSLAWPPFLDVRGCSSALARASVTPYTPRACCLPGIRKVSLAANSSNRRTDEDKANSLLLRRSHHWLSGKHWNAESDSRPGARAYRSRRGSYLRALVPGGEGSCQDRPRPVEISLPVAGPQPELANEDAISR